MPLHKSYIAMNKMRYCGCPKCGTIFDLSAKLSAELAQENRTQSAPTVRCWVCHAVFDIATNLMQKTDDGFVDSGLTQRICTERVHKEDLSQSLYYDSTISATGHADRSQWKQSAESVGREICIDDRERQFAYRVPYSLNIHKEFEPDEDVNAESLYIPASLSGNLVSKTPQIGVTRHKVAHYIADRTNPLMTFIWLIVIAGFVLLLGIQVKYFFVQQYAQDATYRKYLILFCHIADCQLAPRQNPFLFTLTNTRIALHPSEPGALRVTVKAVNKAEFAQPYPHLQLTLTDRVGRVVGRRTFPPMLYLPKGIDNVIGPGQLASIVLNIARPHEKAIGFIVDIVSAPASSAG